MSRAILDTSIFIAVEQGRPLPRELPDEVGVTVVTLAELETWIAATALVHGADVWTQDADFTNFGVVDVVRG